LCEQSLASRQLRGGELSGLPFTYAKLAAAAYEKAQSPTNVDDCYCDRTFGQANSSVYANPNTEEVVLAIRGTDPED
jgi:hypothetical protein